MSKINIEGVGMTSERTRLRLIDRLREQGITNSQVLDIIRETPRHLFLDEALAHRSYEDSALPIGYGQTLSQPYIVARMTEIILAASPGAQKILEVGTGSGYQTAILAQLFPEVYSVERIKPLQEKARARLRKLGLRNVSLKHADGGFGWADKGPYSAIISTAAPREMPEELLKQLAPDGALIIPVGDTAQQLTLVVREGDSDKFVSKVLEPVKFVPLVSGLGR